ncbi:MAG: hypothetical protein ACXVC1_08085 [Tumebacillaceae bacterium]
MKRRTRPSPLKLGTISYGKLDPRVAFTTAFAPYFAKVEVAQGNEELPKPSPKSSSKSSSSRKKSSNT